jgi:hypothetical protein
MFVTVFINQILTQIARVFLLPAKPSHYQDSLTLIMTIRGGFPCEYFMKGGLKGDESLHWLHLTSRLMGLSAADCISIRDCINLPFARRGLARFSHLTVFLSLYRSSFWPCSISFRKDVFNLWVHSCPTVLHFMSVKCSSFSYKSSYSHCQIKLLLLRFCLIQPFIT